MIYSNYPEGEGSEAGGFGHPESQAQPTPEPIEFAADMIATDDTLGEEVGEMISEGAPVGDSMPTATLTLKRAGVISDIKFPFAPPATIGRFDPAREPIEVDLGSLDEGRFVSRSHAKITHDNGEWRLEDLGSSNGTYIFRPKTNEFEKVEFAVIHDGDLIALGNAQFLFQVGVPSLLDEELSPEPIVHEGEQPPSGI
ncbi:MAG: FHA domain-containing protein [Fimbriimonadaceae bacterium]